MDPALRNPMVLLRHDLPDGSWHWDWMLARHPSPPDAPPGLGTLLTLRTRQRPDDQSVTELIAERIGDHRAAYLTLQGDIGGGRGCVTRIAAGWCRIGRDEPGVTEFQTWFAGGERRWLGTLEGTWWRFRATAR